MKEKFINFSSNLHADARGGQLGGRLDNLVAGKVSQSVRPGLQGQEALIRIGHRRRAGDENVV